MQILFAFFLFHIYQIYLIIYFILNINNKKKKIELVTTPSEDKKTFTVKIDYAGYEFMHSYMDINYTNLKLNQYNGINFLELYDDSNMEVILLSGLPGTGKDTYIKKHFSE